MRIFRSIVVIAACCPASLLAESPKLDADNLGEAASMVSLQAMNIEELRKYCGGKLPEHKGSIDGAALNWSDRNQAEIDAAHVWFGDPARKKIHDQVVAGFEPVIAGIRESLKVRDPQQICAALTNAWVNGDSDVAKETPRASKFLRDYLVANPMPAQIAEGRDFIKGCLKQAVE